MNRDFSQATVHVDRVRPSSAVSRWSMDDTDVSSNTITDTWGSNDGTIKPGSSGNNTTVSDMTGATGIGHTGQALNFDGSDDYISISDIWTNYTELTISMWVKRDDLNNIRAVISNGKDGNGHWTAVRMYNDGTPEFGVTNSSGTIDRINGGTSMKTGKWYHIAARYKADDEIAIFLNGVKDVTNKTTVSSLGDAGPTVIGRLDGTEYHKGDLDEVRIYSSALTQQQIWQLYSIGRNANWGYSRS